jgi:hypothetical protein
VADLMPLSRDDWRELMRYFNTLLGKRGESFVQGTVIKSDQVNRLIWLKEFGDQPIPLLAFDYQVKYYYTDGGVTKVKKTKAYSNEEVEILVPRVGDVVLVAQHLGSRRLPKCIGVIKSRNYVRPQGDEG